MTPKTLWNKFKSYPWYLKVLAFLPVGILMIAILMIVGKNDIDESNEKVVKHSKKKTDNVLNEYEKYIDNMKKEREKVENEREKIRKELEDAQTDYADTIKLIDSTPADQLNSVAAKLRADSSSN